MSTLHGLKPMEVVLGRPANEKSVLLVKQKSGKKHKIFANELDTKIKEDRETRKQVSKTIHSVILRGQRRQVRSYRKK